MYKNESGIPLSLAVWLATDNYAYNPDPRVISVTSLIKPIRSFILAQRITDQEEIELSNMVASRMGTAIHSGVENAWINNYKDAMKLLGYPQKVIDRVVLNPDPGMILQEGSIPIFLELRTNKEFMDFIITGQTDFIGEGRLSDFKSTSTYVWMNGSNDELYRLQGSIYRWLNQGLITADDMTIEYIFTDWSKAKSLQDPKYPQTRTKSKKLPLIPINEIERYIAERITTLKNYMDKPESALPRCTPEDLWQRDPVFKYYKNPANKKRSTKNFTSRSEAYARLNADGNVGEVVEVPGEVVFCRYCPAAPICTQ